MENSWTRRNNRATEAGRPRGRWLDVKQAAEELEISSDAVRKRIARNTIRSGKGEDGSVRVWLDGVDEGLNQDQSEGWTEAGPGLGILLDAKDEALRDLRDQLEHMRRESERKDAIIMQMAQRIPELEPASSSQGGPDAPDAVFEGAQTSGSSAPSESQDPSKRHSWLYRFFFGPS